ncbi:MULTISPECIES: hypothetical protein [unclassified Shinella]|nr:MULTISPECIES: hypothetical protein [unclassified Shinella]
MIFRILAAALCCLLLAACATDGEGHLLTNAVVITDHQRGAR